MDVKTKLRCRLTRRKCNQIRKISPKIQRSESLRKVSNILRKKAELRSAEEIAVLARMKDEVKEVKVRICRRQKTIERSKEIEDEHLILRSKCKTLANALQRAKHLVVYTGAGISTAADIPDYRGPNGIWTMLQQGKQIGKHDLTRADPTTTHMALWQLYRKRYLKFVVSQNCDGLHLRSGLPKRALSEVHGNMYVEMCRECKPNRQYWRLFDTTEKTARFSHKTGRICHHCGASLLDSIVHFGERGIAQWPLNWAGALHHAAKADVILCLGSSLKVLKKYPWLWAMDKPIKKRPAIFIVNLQWTPKDDVAELKINGKCDSVMKLVMEFLNLDIPQYYRYTDPIFAHTSYLSPKELHTTSQPMLNRIPEKDINQKLSTSQELATQECVNSKEKTEPPDKLTEHKPMDLDEDDDDCPLNILKIKMNIPFASETKSLKSEITEKKLEQKSESENNITCTLNKMPMETNLCDITDENEKCKETTDELNFMESNHETKTVSNITLDKPSLQMETVDFSCTVNVEESLDIVKSEYSEDLYNCGNLKINAIINNNLNVKSEVTDAKSDSTNKVEGISMEILAEEFERVHVEMKTNDNEIHKVSILLVNKSKTPPKKCDKFQQTDPETSYEDQKEYSPCKIIKEDLSAEIELLDTGQNCDTSIKQEICEALCLKQESQNDFEAENVSSHSIIDSRGKSTQVNCSISKSFLKQSVISCESNYFSQEKSVHSNSLRNFRRLKDIKKTLFSVPFNSHSVQSRADDKIEWSPQSTVEKLGKPLDFSIKQKPVFNPCIRVPTYVPERSMKSSCILKIPKPPLYLSRNGHSNNSNSCINLSIPSNLPPELANSTNYFNGMINSNSAIAVTEEGKLDEESYATFKRKCESLARAIIQNTLLVNHNELQYAYSGIHSIINPVPFNVQYDFKSVFNAFNFIHLGQKLMSKGRTTRSSFSNGKSKMVSESIIKKQRILRKQRNSFKKKDPQCKFCHEQYKSYVCNFYTAYNSDDRFEKYYKNKLVMCDCCGDSDSSDDSEDNLPLRERKSKPEVKSTDDSECNSSNVEDGKVLKCNSDLKNGVQISLTDNNNVEARSEHAQPGWFGKGFRKNRRRKR